MNYISLGIAVCLSGTVFGNYPFKDRSLLRKLCDLLMLPLIGKNATSFGFCQKQDHEVVIVEAVAIQERDESTCCLAMH